MDDIEDGIPIDQFREFCCFLQWAASEVRAGRLEAGPHSCRYGTLPRDVSKAAALWHFRERTDGEGGWREHGTANSTATRATSRPGE
jgi:hypothetical protein